MKTLKAIPFLLYFLLFISAAPATEWCAVECEPVCCPGDISGCIPGACTSCYVIPCNDTPAPPPCAYTGACLNSDTNLKPQLRLRSEDGWYQDGDVVKRRTPGASLFNPAANEVMVSSCQLKKQGGVLKPNQVEYMRLKPGAPSLLPTLVLNPKNPTGRPSSN